jgi:hypothetical protein
VSAELLRAVGRCDPAAIVKRALEALLTETQKKKTAATEKPRTASMPRGIRGRSSRAVPAQLKRAVWKRDQGRCGFISEGGHRCGATRALEYALQPNVHGGTLLQVHGRRLRPSPHHVRGRRCQGRSNYFGCNWTKN